MSTITLEASGCDTLDRIWAMQGDRIRLTWPNRHQRVGVVGAWKFSDGRAVGTLDGTILTGEASSVVRIERMGENGRYEEVWAR